MFDLTNYPPPKSKSEDEQFRTTELNHLREQAWNKLTLLGYFDKTAKELQHFEVKILAVPRSYEWEQPPMNYFYNITVSHKPYPVFVITKDHIFRGSKVNLNKTLVPFTACNKDKVVLSPRGSAGHGAHYKKILEAIIARNIPPIKRPV